MFKNISAAATYLLWLQIFLLSPVQTQEQTHVAFLPFANHADMDEGGESLNHLVLALNTRVTAQLLEQYDCVVLSRSNGYNLGVESSIAAFAAIMDRQIAVPAMPPAAEHAFVGYIGNKGRQLECVLVLANPKHGAGQEDMKISIDISSRDRLLDEGSEKIAEAVASALHLQKRQAGKDEKTESRTTETWAVLPIPDLTTEQAAIRLDDGGFSIAVEAALQSSGLIKNLVERATIDKILNELQLQSVAGSSPQFAAGLARLAGADKMISGAMSRIGNEQDKRRRIDLTAVDARTGAVVSAASAELVGDADFEKIADQLVLALIDRSELRSNPQPGAQADRRRESEFYSRTAGGSDLEVAGTLAAKAFRISCVEAVWMLAQDMPDVLLDAGWAYPKIFEQTLKWRSYNVPGADRIQLPPAYLAQAVRVFEAILRQTMRDHPYAALLLAEIHLRAGTPEEAISLAEGTMKLPGKHLLREANSILAKSNYELGRYDLAKAHLMQSEMKADLAARIYHALGEEHLEIKHLRRLNYRDGGWAMSPELDRLLVLLRKNNQPEVVLEIIEGVHQWGKIRVTVQLHAAHSHRALGRDDEAVKILSRLLDPKSASIWRYEENATREEAEKVLAELGGAKDEQWKTFAEVVTPQENLKLYVAPLADVDLKLVTLAVEQAGKFLGLPVELLAAMPIPEDEKAFDRTRLQYDTNQLLRRISYSWQPPADALYVIFVTREDIYFGNFRYVYSSSTKQYGAVHSYNRWARFRELKQPQLSEMLGKTISSDMNFISRRSYGKKACSNDACLFSGSGDMLGPLRKNFGMCEDCQGFYAHVDLQKVRDYFHNQRLDLPALEPDEQRLVEEYKKRLLTATDAPPSQ